MTTNVSFSFLHFIREPWRNPLRFAIYTSFCTLLAIIVSSTFRSTGSSVFLFLLTLAYIPFMFHAAGRVKHISDIKKWWKHALIIFVVTVVFYSAYALVSPVNTLDYRFEAQWEQIEGYGIDSRPGPSITAFQFVALNNIQVVIKIVILSLLGAGGIYLFLYSASSLAIFLTTFLMAKKDIIFSSGAPSFIAFLTLTYLPHNILEFSSFIIAGLGSVKLIVDIYNKSGSWQSRISDSLPQFLKFFLLSILLVLIAAAFETFVDPWLASFFYSNEFIFLVPGDPTTLL